MRPSGAGYWAHGPVTGLIGWHMIGGQCRQRRRQVSGPVRSRESTDRRSVTLCVTTAASERAAQFMSLTGPGLESALTGFDTSELETVGRFLETLTSATTTINTRLRHDNGPIAEIHPSPHGSASAAADKRRQVAVELVRHHPGPSTPGRQGRGRSERAGRSAQGPRGINPHAKPAASPLRALGFLMRAQQSVENVVSARHKTASFNSA